MQNIFLRVLAVGAIAAAALYGADSAAGTWKLNAGKSTSTSANAVKNRTEVYAVMADGSVEITRTDLRADGTASSYRYSFKCDGKDYPVTGTLYDTVSCKRVDALTTIMDVRKTGGKLHISTRNVVSKDGKTKTQTNIGTDVDGKTIKSIYVYERQ